MSNLYIVYNVIASKIKCGVQIEHTKIFVAQNPLLWLALGGVNMARPKFSEHPQSTLENGDDGL